MSDILQIKSVTKKFGNLVAVNDVSLSVKPGTIYALIGPNGSGKTTLVNCVVGLLRPDVGEVNIKGVNILEKPVVAKHLFSYVSDNPAIYPYLSGEEFIRLSGKLHGLSESVIDTRFSELKKIFPMADILETRTESYSRGNIEKTAFLSALISHPELLVIDEPIVGLDTASVEIFGRSLRRFVKQGSSVFISTHTLSFVEKFADTVGIIRNGTLVKEIPIGPKINLEDIYLKTTS